MKREKLDGLKFENLEFYYDPQELVFSEFNYNFNDGEVIYLQGARGSGKNTLIRLLTGLIAPTDGAYLINGVKVNDFSYHEFDPFRLCMGHSSDNGGLINNLSLYENFRLVLDYHNYLPENKRHEYLIDLFEHFQLDNLKHLRPALLSGSAKKAASVLRAFVLRPELLILDNPTQGMSTEHVPALIELISKHRKKFSLKYIIISSNDSELISGLDGRAVQVMKNGLIEYKTIRRAS